MQIKSKKNAPPGTKHGKSGQKQAPVKQTGESGKRKATSGAEQGQHATAKKHKSAADSAGSAMYVFAYTTLAYVDIMFL